MSLITFLKNAAPIKRSTKFWDIFIFIHFYMAFLFLTQTAGSFGVVDGLMVLGMALIVVFFEPLWLISFLVYLLCSVVIAMHISNISHVKFSKIHCGIWLLFASTFGLWIIGIMMGILPYNTSLRTYF